MTTYLCIATYNERENVPRLVAEIRARLPQAHLVVVDDNSPDGTGELLDDLARQDPRLHPRHRAGKLGYGSAHREAMAYALAQGAEVVLTMDADFSHDPKYLPDLVGLVEQGADLAVGSRYVPGGGTQDWPWHRRCLSATANALARWGLGLPVHDCTGGFRAYRAELLRQLPLANFRSEGYSFLEEILVAADEAGAQMRETPIVFVERRAGASKISKHVIFEAAWLLARMTWRRQVRRLCKPGCPSADGGR